MVVARIVSGLARNMLLRHMAGTSKATDKAMEDARKHYRRGMRQIPGDLHVRGSDDFYRAARVMKAAGPEIRKAVLAELRSSARPLIDDARRAAAANLPQRGGLAAQVAREPMRVRTRTGVTTAGVQVVVGRRKGGARATNRGYVRHPVFADGRKSRDQWTWVNQPLPSAKGWFDKSMLNGAPQIRADLERIIGRALDDIARDAGR
ncbi:hypothetical protein [Intrasporangium sp.]|uniref:hypothetical protein n=1 Tax=Intrasporangium sp. TaxID=1925024 RepID=UPI003222138A